MKITQRIAMEIIQHDAIVRQAYKDGGGIWTWGVGVTSKSGHKVERYIGNPQSMEHVLRVFVWLLLTEYAPAVEKAFAGVKLTETQQAAALSFHWNTGGISKASWVKHFKAGNIAKARKAFMQWRKPASIIDRRKAERDLFFNGKWTSRGTAGEYTRVSKNGTPVWGSLKKIDISMALHDVLRPVPAPVDHVTTPPKYPATAPKRRLPGKGTAGTVIGLGAATLAAWAAIQHFFGG